MNQRQMLNNGSSEPRRHSFGQINFQRTPQARAATTPKSPEDSHVKLAVETWQRIQIYEANQRFNQVYRVGTIYNKDVDLLARQIARMLWGRWGIRSTAEIFIERQRHEIYITLPNWRGLTLHYQVPGNSNQRSLGQNFGSLCRTVMMELTEQTPALKPML